MEILKKGKQRTLSTSDEVRRTVAEIIENIRTGGDQSLLEYNRKFDGCTRPNLKVTNEEVRQAYTEVSEADLADIKQAAANIRAFAEAQRESMLDVPSFSPMPGVTLGHRHIPVRAACCYVPGGSYPLYSTALMLAIPAKVAGVERVAATSPAVKGTNSIHPKTLVAMDVAGVDEIYVAGGAQAVAAFAYGTDQIAPVDLIVGPGNAFVTEAKRTCYGQVGIDFVAGPSEVLVLADHTGDADIIAADLLGQCEHDRLAQAIVVTTDRNLGQKIIAAVEDQLKTLETAAIARPSWDEYGEVVVAADLDEAIKCTNDRAPEHLEIQVADTEEVAARLYNYGSLFIGKYAAEVFGDYASGTNHTLPTLRAARYTGGVWVGTFLKTSTHQSLTAEAMPIMASLVSRLARGEGLIAHAKAAEIRGKKI